MTVRRWFRCTGVALMLFLLSDTAVGAEPAGPVVPNRDELVRELRAQNRKLLNIKVIAESWKEVRRAGSETWERTPVCSAITAWYNGLPNSKGRINYHKRILPWTGGTAPYAEDAMDGGFDGERGWSAHHLTGAMGKTFPVKTGYIQGECPKGLHVEDTGNETGARFTTYYWQAEEKSLPDFLATLPSQASLLVTREMFQGVQAIKVVAEKKDILSYLFWFDPARGYALLGYRRTATSPTKGLWVIHDDRVLQLREAGPGIWYPTEAYRDYAQIAGSEVTRVRYRASAVTANDPKFDETIFHPQIPEGYTLEDRIAGKIYQVAPAPEKLQSDLGGLVAQIAATTQQAGISPAGDAESPDASGRPTPVMRIVLICCLALFALIVAVLAGMAVRRRRAVGATAVFLVLCLCHTTTGRAGEPAEPSGGIWQPVPFRMNCAVNTGYVVSRYFGKQLTLDEFARRIHAGPAAERDCSLLDMKRAMISFGLDVEGLSSQPVERLLGFARGNAVLIVRLKGSTGRQNDGHFIIVVGLRDGYLIVDPPYESAVVKRSNINENRLLSLATGEFLRVAEPPAIRYDHPAIELEDDLIDVGSIPLTDTQIEGRIRYRNRGKQPLRILAVGATCGCTTGSSGDKEVAPGGRGVITVVFDKRKLPTGEVDRQVNLATNDPRNEVVKVTFKFCVQNAPAPTDLRLSPQVLSLGRAEQAVIGARAATIYLALPKETREEASAIKETLSTPRLALSRVDECWDTEGDGTQTHILRYRLSWKEPPPDGTIREEIRFTIDGRSHGKRDLVVRIEGDCLAAGGNLQSPAAQSMSTR